MGNMANMDKLATAGALPEHPPKDWPCSVQASGLEIHGERDWLAWHSKPELLAAMKCVPGFLTSRN